MSQSAKLQYLLDAIQDHVALGRNLSEAERKLRAVATDAELEEALAAFKEKTEKTRENSRSEILVDSVETSGWYTGPSNDPASQWALLKEVLKNKKSRPWNNEMINGLDHASSLVMAHLAPPKSQVSSAAKGLVLGYVQSGKTANFSAVISKAVDSGYKLVVVLAGMHNILRLQTQARLHEEIVAPKETSCTTLTKVDENGDFQKKQFVTAGRALNAKDGFTLVVLKKNAAVLRSFNSWLQESEQSLISNCPTLVIDDESDQASVNTNKPEDDATAINNHIRKILKTFKVISYVGYTATPFANVLIDSGISDDLYPRDFIVTLEKPIGYVGTEELFGRDAIEPHGPLQGLPVLRTIPIEHKEKPKKKGVAKQAADIPESLLNAVDSFILGSSIRLCRNHWTNHMTMLIHTSHLVSSHTQLKEAFDSYVLNLKLDRREESEELKLRLQALWEEDFKKTSSLFKAAQSLSFEAIWKNTEKFIERLDVVMENHQSEERLTYNRPDPFWGIVIGGNTLSRGLTLEGLTTSYFVRGSKGYDTLLQMGRWFGYRPDYVDVTRIFVTEELQSKFYHLATVEQEIRDEIRVMAANKERPIDVGLKIRTHPAMTVTSSIKMRSAQACNLTYSASKIQALYMRLNDKKLLESNLAAVFDLQKDLEKYTGPCLKPEFEDLNACLLYRKASPELIQQFLDRYDFSKANSRFSSKMISDYIHLQNEEGELTDWSVAFMSSKSGNLTQLHNGRSIYKVNRSVMKIANSEIDPEASHLKVITVSRDELVDLYDLFPNKPRTADLALGGESRIISETSIRQNLRPKERGLVLLYALNPQPDSEVRVLRPDTYTEPLRAVMDCFAVAFVFPKSQNFKGTLKYVVNKTV